MQRFCPRSGSFVHGAVAGSPERVENVSDLTLQEAACLQQMEQVDLLLVGWEGDPGVDCELAGQPLAEEPQAEEARHRIDREHELGLRAEGDEGRVEVLQNRISATSLAASRASAEEQDTDRRSDSVG